MEILMLVMITCQFGDPSRSVDCQNEMKKCVKEQQRSPASINESQHEILTTCLINFEKGEARLPINVNDGPRASEK